MAEQVDIVTHKDTGQMIVLRDEASKRWFDNRDPEMWIRGTATVHEAGGCAPPIVSPVYESQKMPTISAGSIRGAYGGGK